MIKWIGQHIVSLIARFRDDVYLENLAETTQDHVVGIDADGKLYKQDKGTTDSFTVEDGDTTDVVISNGKHWKFVEGGGIDINWTDTSNGTSSDEYDLTFTLSKNLQDLLIDAGHSIRGIAGSDIVVQSTQDINLQLDYDQASTAGAHSFKITNGDGNTIFSVDEDGNIVTRGSITAQTAGGATKHPSKGSSGNLLVDDAGVVSTRPVSDLKTDLALAKADVGLGSAENKSSATIRGEIVDSDIPALNASKVTGGTFDDARIPSLGASKVTSGTFDDARIPSLGASKVTSGTFADARIPDLNVSKLTAGTLSAARGGTGVADVKQIITRQAFQCNFIDDIGTTKHYLPLAGIQENTVRYQDEAAMLAPCDGRVASVTLKMENLGGASGDITFGVEVAENPGAGYAQTWTTVETETFTIGSGDNHDTFHFHFTQSTAGANNGTSKHFDATMMWAISIQSDDSSLGGDGGNDERWFVTAVVEWDWSTYLGTEGTTTKYTSVP